MSTKDTHGHQSTGYGKKLIPVFIGLFGIGFFVPSLVYAAPTTFAQFVKVIIDIINPLAGLLITFAILMFFFTVIRYISSAGAESRTKYRENLTWSMIGIFVIVSVWGLARLVSMTLLGDTSTAGTTRNDGINPQVFQQPGCGPTCI